MDVPQNDGTSSTPCLFDMLAIRVPPDGGIHGRDGGRCLSTMSFDLLLFTQVSIRGLETPSHVLFDRYLTNRVRPLFFLAFVF